MILLLTSISVIFCFHVIPSSLLKQRSSKADFRFSSALLCVHDSQPYRVIDVIRELISLTLTTMDIPLELQILLSFSSWLVAIASLLLTPCSEVTSVFSVEPRYWKVCNSVKWSANATDGPLQISDSRYQTPGTRLQVPDSRYQTPGCGQTPCSHKNEMLSSLLQHSPIWCSIASPGIGNFWPILGEIK